MPRPDPILPSTERTALAWLRYKRLMSWMAIVAVVAVLLALIYLKSSGREVPIHMAIATIAGVGLSVLLGTGLMGLVYFSSHSGHDDHIGRGDGHDG
jgi:multidrug transporter EmrE-like cation transporter